MFAFFRTWWQRKTREKIRRAIKEQLLYEEGHSLRMAARLEEHGSKSLKTLFALDGLTDPGAYTPSQRQTAVEHRVRGIYFPKKPPRNVGRMIAEELLAEIARRDALADAG